MLSLLSIRYILRLSNLALKLLKLIAKIDLPQFATGLEDFHIVSGLMNPRYFPTALRFNLVIPVHLLIT